MEMRCKQSSLESLFIRSLYFSSWSILQESHLSSVSEAGLDCLQGGELKGVPVSVSLELSRWLLSREIRFELPPLELRFKSAMLCSKDRNPEEKGQRRSPSGR